MARRGWCTCGSDTTTPLRGGLLGEIRRAIGEGRILFTYSENDPLLHVDLYGLSPSKYPHFESGGGFCPDSCGPEIGAEVFRVVQDVKYWFNTWNEQKKLTRCQQISDIVVFSITDNWDIQQIGPTDPQNGYSTWCPDSGCATRECAFTASYFGQCVPVYGLNYILFGTMMRKCHDWAKTNPTMEFFSVDYDLQSTKNWVRLRNWVSSTPPLTKHENESKLEWATKGWTNNESPRAYYLRTECTKVFSEIRFFSAPPLYGAMGRCRILVGW